MSVGSVGSPEGYSTVIIRSSIGKKLFEKIALIKGDVNKEALTKLARLKKKRAYWNFAPILDYKQIIESSIH